jgi:hypothetical protein
VGLNSALGCRDVERLGAGAAAGRGGCQPGKSHRAVVGWVSCELGRIEVLAPASQAEGQLIVRRVRSSVDTACVAAKGQLKSTQR